MFRTNPSTLMADKTPLLAGNQTEAAPPTTPAGAGYGTPIPEGDEEGVSAASGSPQDAVPEGVLTPPSVVSGGGGEPYQLQPQRDATFAAQEAAAAVGRHHQRQQHGGDGGGYGGGEVQQNNKRGYGGTGPGGVGVDSTLACGVLEGMDDFNFLDGYN